MSSATSSSALNNVKQWTSILTSISFVEIQLLAFVIATAQLAKMNNCTILQNVQLCVSLILCY